MGPLQELLGRKPFLTEWSWVEFFKPSIRLDPRDARGGVSHDQAPHVVRVIVRDYGWDSCYSRDIRALVGLTVVGDVKETVGNASDIY